MTHSFPTRRSSDLLACHVLPAPNTALGRALAGVAAHDQPAYLGIGIGEVARQAEAIDRAQDRLDFGALGNQLARVGELERGQQRAVDRKSTRLNSSH